MITPLRKMIASHDAVRAARDDLEALREVVAERRSELARIEAAPIPANEAAAELGAWMDRAATAALDRLGLGAMLEPGGARHGLTLPAPWVPRPEGLLSAT